LSVPLTKYYSREEIRKNEMGGASEHVWGEERCTHGLVWKPEKGVHGRIILK
jgi:hypothetical protein